MHLFAWFTMLGELDRAYEFVEQVRRHDLPRKTVGLLLPWVWLPELLPFRQDPRFQQLVQGLRPIDYWKQYGPPDECELQGETLVCR